MRTQAPISNSSRRRLARWLVGSPISVVERDLILETLIHTRGNRTLTAQMLGISVRSLRNKISAYSARGFHIHHPERHGQSATMVALSDQRNDHETPLMSARCASVSQERSTDNLRTRDQPDGSKINMSENLEVNRETLQKAVDKVGNSAATVGNELGISSASHS